MEFSKGKLIAESVTFEPAPVTPDIFRSAGTGSLIGSISITGEMLYYI